MAFHDDDDDDDDGDDDDDDDDAGISLVVKIWHVFNESMLGTIGHNVRFAW